MIWLGLDLSKRRTGWAVDGNNTCPPRAGAFSPPHGDLGDLCISYESWLYDFIGLYRIEGVAFEAPIMGNRGGGIIMDQETVEALVGLAFVTRGICRSRKIVAKSAHVQTVRKHFVGSGRPPNPKRAVMDRCKQLNWPAPNTDATDAIAVWAWAKANFDKTFRLEAATPLFGRPVDIPA